MNTRALNEIADTLDHAKFYGLCDGSRIYRVQRGFFQVQNSTRPNRSTFNGTKREIEAAMGHKIIRISPVP